MKPPTNAALRRKYRKDYADLFAESDHEVCMDGTVLRWKAKPAMRWIADRTDLNALWVACYQNGWPMSDLKQFYRDMGYSLSGFVDVFGEGT